MPHSVCDTPHVTRIMMGSDDDAGSTSIDHDNGTGTGSGLLTNVFRLATLDAVHWRCDALDDAVLLQRLRSARIDSCNSGQMDIDTLVRVLEQHYANHIDVGAHDSSALDIVCVNANELRRWVFALNQPLPLVSNELDRGTLDKLNNIALFHGALELRLRRLASLPGSIDARFHFFTDCKVIYASLLLRSTYLSRVPFLSSSIEDRADQGAFQDQMIVKRIAGALLDKVATTMYVIYCNYKGVVASTLCDADVTHVISSNLVTSSLPEPTKHSGTDSLMIHELQSLHSHELTTASTSVRGEGDSAADNTPGPTHELLQSHHRMQQRKLSKSSFRSPIQFDSLFETRPHPFSKCVSLPVVYSIQVPERLKRMVAMRRYYSVHHSNARDTFPSDIHPPKLHGVKRRRSSLVSNSKAPMMTLVLNDISTDERGEDGSPIILSSDSSSTISPQSKDIITSDILFLVQQQWNDPVFCSLFRGVDSSPFLAHLPQFSVSSASIAPSTLDSLKYQEIIQGLDTLQCAVNHSIQLCKCIDDAAADTAVSSNSSSNSSSSKIVRKRLEEPRLLTGFDDDIRTMDVCAIRFWEQACLEPFHSKVDINYMIAHPFDGDEDENGYIGPAGVDAIMHFFTELGCMYESCLFGSHRPIDDIFMDLLQLHKQSIGKTSIHSRLQSYFQVLYNFLSSDRVQSILSGEEASKCIVVYIVLPHNIDATSHANELCEWLSRIRSTLTGELMSGASPTTKQQQQTVIDNGDGASSSSTTASHKRQVIFQTVPLDFCSQFSEDISGSTCIALKDIAFAVYTRTRFMPPIIHHNNNDIMNSNMKNHATHMSNNLFVESCGAAPYRPAYILHAEIPIPSLFIHQSYTKLAVHFSYTYVADDQLQKQSMDHNDMNDVNHTNTLDYNENVHRYFVGAAMDMRGEAMHTSVVRLQNSKRFTNEHCNRNDGGDDNERMTMIRGLDQLWIHAIRPVLGVLSSRYDRHDICLVITRLGSFLDGELNAVETMIARQLQFKTASYHRSSSSSQLDATMMNYSIDTMEKDKDRMNDDDDNNNDNDDDDDAKSSSGSNTSIMPVSCVYITYCTGSPSTYWLNHHDHMTNIDTPCNMWTSYIVNHMKLQFNHHHHHQSIRTCDLYLAPMPNDLQSASSFKLSLTAFMLTFNHHHHHHCNVPIINTDDDDNGLCTSFDAIARQLAALSFLDAQLVFGRHNYRLPLHFTANLRLAALVASLLSSSK